MAEKNETLETAKLNIHQKILKIADGAGILQKSKAGYNFKYVPEEDIQAKVTGLMQKYKVMLYLHIVPGTLKIDSRYYTVYDKKLGKEVPANDVIVSADTVYTWVNCDNPTERVEIPWILAGCMEDVSQAFGAGSTYCNRYFLMKSAQLATSEADPDAYRSKQKEAAEYEEDKELKKEIKQLVAKGSELITTGVASSDVVAKTVAKYNNGDKNPSSIKSTEVCQKIYSELESLKEKKPNTKNKGE